MDAVFPFISNSSAGMDIFWDVSRVVQQKLANISEVLTKYVIRLRSSSCLKRRSISTTPHGQLFQKTVVFVLAENLISHMGMLFDFKIWINLNCGSKTQVSALLITPLKTTQSQFYHLSHTRSNSMR